MTIRLWKIEDDGEAYDALSAEQKQFADFIWKMDWEVASTVCWVIPERSTSLTA